MLDGLKRSRCHTKKAGHLWCPALFLTRTSDLLEDEPRAHHCLPGEPAAASQIRQHEEGCRQPPVLICRHWIIEVRAVRDVVDVQEQFQRPLRPDLVPPAGSNVELEIIGTNRAVPSAFVLHIFHRVRGGPAIGAGGDRIDELAIAIGVDAGVVNRERRAAHVPRGARQRDPMGFRNLCLGAERQNVTPVHVAGPAPGVQVEVRPDLILVLVSLVVGRAITGMSAFT